VWLELEDTDDPEDRARLGLCVYVNARALGSLLGAVVMDVPDPGETVDAWCEPAPPRGRTSI
jgi:hypothetical protein